MVQRRPATGKPKNGQPVQWVARWKIPGRSPGSKTFLTKREATDYEREQKRAVARGEWVDLKAAPTLAALWKDWEKAATTDGTKTVRKRVGRQLGDLTNMRITDIRPTHLRTWLSHLQDGRPWIPGDTGLSQNTRAQHWGQLTGCLHMAVADNLILVSPTDKVKGPRKKIEADPAKFPLIDRVSAAVKLADTTDRSTLATMIMLAAATGMRSGEVCGLRWSNVDRRNQTIHIVEQAASTMKGDEWKWMDVKVSSRRTVPVPKEIITRLTKHRLAHPGLMDGNVEGPLFRTPTGLMWNSDRLAKAMEALTKPVGRFSFHALRHVYASALIHGGRSPKSAQHVLGHATSSTTMDVYAHVWPEEDQRVRDVSAGLLRDLAGDERGMDGAEAASGDE
ncbi:MAG: tyrosine-type recombinase/integrase [Corynebacterium sp.]|uniref:tyrosine-type recombinase/integrase n=1 Tax=Corynebacterium sp. TaxID=1720 RepID=UPI003F0AFC62